MSEEESTSVGRGANGGAQFRVSWRAVSIALLLVSVATIATLAVVASTNDLDALSTVALALAILSFAAQLLITVGQSWSDAEQYRRMNRLFGRTRGAVERVAVQSEALLTNQRDLLEKLLEHVLSPSALEAAIERARDAGDGEGDGNLQAESEIVNAPTAEAVSKVLRQEADKLLEPPLDPAQIYRRVPADASEFLSFPSQTEGDDVLQSFRTLSDPSKKRIRNIGSAIAERKSSPLLYVRRLVPQSAARSAEIYAELIAAGFVEIEPVRRGNTERSRILYTPKGQIAIRFFSGQGTIPEWLRADLANIPE